MLCAGGREGCIPCAGGAGWRALCADRFAGARGGCAVHWSLLEVMRCVHALCAIDAGDAGLCVYFVEC